MGFITLSETGQQWSDWNAVASATSGASTGGLGGKDLAGLSSVTLIQTGDVLGSQTAIQFTKGAGVPIVVKGAGFNRVADLASQTIYVPRYTSNRAKIDCNGLDTGLAFSNLSNVSLQGLQIANGNVNSSSASMVRFLNMTGTNLMEFCDWINGAIACRYTGSIGDITVQYCNVIGHGYGAFRFGAGQSGLVTDIGNTIIRYNNFRWNRGYMSTAQRIGMGVPLLAGVDYAATDPSQTIGFHGCIVLKNAPSIQVYGNYVDGAGQFAMVLENTPTILVDSNYYLDAGIGTATGGVMTVTPNGGNAPAMTIQRNLAMNNNGSFMSTSGSDLLQLYENTNIELRKQVDSAAATVITGNVKNVCSMTSSGSLKAVNNLWISNPANISAFWAFPASGSAITSAVMDYNTYDRGGNGSRGFTSGFVNGVNVGTPTQATFQAQDQSAFDSTFPLREAHGKFTSGSVTSVTNSEILRGLYRRLPAPLAGGSVTYPVFCPYACTIQVKDTDGATVTGVPTGSVAANSTTNITVNGTGGQIPTITLKSLL